MIKPVKNHFFFTIFQERAQQVPSQLTKVFSKIGISLGWGLIFGIPTLLMGRNLQTPTTAPFATITSSALTYQYYLPKTKKQRLFSNTNMENHTAVQAFNSNGESEAVAIAGGSEVNQMESSSAYDFSLSHEEELDVVYSGRSKRELPKDEEKLAETKQKLEKTQQKLEKTQQRVEKTKQKLEKLQKKGKLPSSAVNPSEAQQPPNVLAQVFELQQRRIQEPVDGLLPQTQGDVLETPTNLDAYFENLDKQLVNVTQQQPQRNTFTGNRVNTVSLQPSSINLQVFDPELPGGIEGNAEYTQNFGYIGATGQERWKILMEGTVPEGSQVLTGTLNNLSLQPTNNADPQLFTKGLDNINTNKRSNFNNGSNSQ
jgi:hypothetical protein